MLKLLNLFMSPNKFQTFFIFFINVVAQTYGQTTSTLFRITYVHAR